MPVCIGGMNRSGTSMVAKLLHLCGLYLGQERDLIPAGPENSDGFWENIKLLEINSELLNELGGAWDCPPSIPDRWNGKKEIFRLRAKAKVILGEFLDREPWGWKDPRNSLTLPFWMTLIPEIKSVICLRNPLEVALSLHQRNGVSYAFGLTLWKTYCQQILESTSIQDRIITHYDAYFHDPRAELRRVLDFLNMPVSEETIDQCLSAASAKLRHNRFTIQHLIDADVSPAMVNLYAQMCEEAGWLDDGVAYRDPKANGSPSATSQWLREWSDNGEQPLLTEQREGAAAERERTMPESSMAVLGVGGLNRSAVQAELLRQQQEISNTKATAQEATNQDLQERLAKQEAENRNLREQLAGREARNLDLQERLEKREATNRDLQERSAEREAMNQDLQERSAEREATNRDLQERLADWDARNRDLRELLEKRDARNRDLQGQLAVIQTRFEEIKGINYQQLVHRIREVVRAALPADATVIVASKGDDELLQLDGRQGWHFPRTEDGTYAGYYPADSRAAIDHLEELRGKGGSFLLFPGTALWWLEYYGELKQHLESWYRVVYQEDTCVIFKLTSRRSLSQVFKSFSGRVVSASWQRVRRELRRLKPRISKDNLARTEKEVAVEPRELVQEPAGTQETPARPTRNSSAGPRSVDVVVCVHNALDDVKACMVSVIEGSPEMGALYVVNDGSDAATTDYLREFSKTHSSCVLLESPVAEGYTRSANKGLRASTADYVVLLNSDTLVPPGWLERLLECGESDHRIGIISPLSNAASWQSVPEVNANGDWAVNPLPEGYGVADMAEVVSAASEKRFPRVPFVNGFCLTIKRSLIDSIGYFDEESFPYGYGEENDYCLRARDAGFELAVADHSYIYHAKSKSYSHKRRHVLRKLGSDALKRKHGTERISWGVDLIRNEPTLEKFRQRLRAILQARPGGSGQFEHLPLKILFLLPCKGGGGGVHSVVQEGQGMLELGIFAQIAVPVKYREQYLKEYPNMDRGAFYFIEDEESLIEHAKGFDVVVATIFTSVKVLRLIHRSIPDILPAYYIQDYEPWICNGNSELEEEAKNSYIAIPDALCFAKTNWLCRTVEGFHGIEVRKVSPSLDHSVYYSSFRTKREGPVKIVAMVRPKTPRRSPAETMQVLKSIQSKYESDVSITVFGCESDDPQFLALPRDFEFENRGVLIREEVAELLRGAEIFLDLSKYQAFGRTGLEAMACGCATVLPENGGTSEYARHRENTLLVDTEDFREMVDATSELIDDESLFREISEQAILTAAAYSIRRTVVSELLVFQEELRKKAEALPEPRRK